MKLEVWNKCISVQKIPLSQFFDSETDNSKLIASNQFLLLYVELISSIGILYAGKLNLKKIRKIG